MNALGPLQNNRPYQDADLAWNRPNLQGPETLIVTSAVIDFGGIIPFEGFDERVSAMNVSPEITWSLLQAEATWLLLVVEKTDASSSESAAHCVALINPSRLDHPNQLSAGAVSVHEPSAGVNVLCSATANGQYGTHIFHF